MPRLQIGFRYASADVAYKGKQFTSTQERRKVEEAYVAGLRKLSKRPLPEVAGDLGYCPFQLTPCDTLLT